MTNTYESKTEAALMLANKWGLTVEVIPPRSATTTQARIDRILFLAPSDELTSEGFIVNVQCTTAGDWCISLGHEDEEDFNYGYAEGTALDEALDNLIAELDGSTSSAARKEAALVLIHIKRDQEACDGWVGTFIHEAYRALREDSDKYKAAVWTRIAALPEEDLTRNILYVTAVTHAMLQGRCASINDLLSVAALARLDPILNEAS